MQKILVTGSSGSVGTALSEELLKRGYDVVGADLRANEWNKELDRRTVRVDLRDPSATLASLPADIDSIFHLAAHSRVWDLVENPSLADENILMMKNVLEYAKTRGIRKVIFTSSREVYGNVRKDSYREEDASREACENPYATSKFDGETLLKEYRADGIDSVVVRLANVYGRYDTLNRVIPLFIAHCLARKPIDIFGRGKALDFVFIDDAVDGIIRALDRFDQAKNEPYNIASGTGLELSELAEMLKKLTASPVTVSVSDNREGEVMRYVGNIEKAKRVLGYEPKTAFAEGLKRAIEWYSDFYAKYPERMPIRAS